MPASQCGFLEYIVLPLVNEVSSLILRKGCEAESITANGSGAVSTSNENTGNFLMDTILSNTNSNLDKWKARVAGSRPPGASDMPKCTGDGSNAEESD